LVIQLSLLALSNKNLADFYLLRKLLDGVNFCLIFCFSPYFEGKRKSFPKKKDVLYIIAQLKNLRKYHIEQNAGRSLGSFKLSI